MREFLTLYLSPKLYALHTLPISISIIIVQVLQNISEGSGQDVVVSMETWVGPRRELDKHGNLLKVKIRIVDKHGAYLVVSLCSTPIASITVVVYSIPVERLLPLD